jgi:hypothetical protein
MSQGDKSSYTDKQKRQAVHIEAGYEKKGVGVKTAKAAPGLPSINFPAAAKRTALTGTTIDLPLCG